MDPSAARPLPHPRSLPRARAARTTLPALVTLLAFADFVGFGTVRLVAAAAAEPVALVRIPDVGIQPQAAVDDRGTLHLVYFKGEAGGGDLFYARRPVDGGEFTAPVRVNQRPHDAIATGTIRGAQMALGRGGRIHVAWNGLPPAGGSYLQAPMLYTRLDDSGTAFEPERDLITEARGLDGGGSVAADEKGNVHVFWHAPRPGNTRGEAGRAVFVSSSNDDGRHFAPERTALEIATGACGCCGMKAFADPRGHLFASFRAATESTNRGQTLIVAPPGQPGFRILFEHPWTIATCPMSSPSFASTPTAVLAAWETAGNVFFARIDPATLAVGTPIAPRGSARRKHPVAVGNAHGEVLLAWTEGTSWGKGGEIVWQRYDREDRPLAGEERAPGLPAWSLVGAVVRPDGRFLLLY